MAVDRVARTALSELSNHILDASVPAGSLLAAILQFGVEPAPQPIGERAGDEEEVLPISEHAIFPLRLVFHPNAGPSLRIKGLGDFSGAHLSLVGNLRGCLEQDVEAGKPPHDHRFVPSGRLGDSKGQVRQHAKRCRDEFAEEYEVIEGVKPDSPILVHSRNPHGYRLDPEAQFVER